MPSGAPRTLRMLDDGGRMLAPVTGVAELFSFRWRWEPVARRLTCWRGRDTVELVQEAPFALVNGRTVLLPEGPVRAGGDLFLPLPLVADVFNPFSDRVLRWDTDGRAVGLFESPFTVTSVACAREDTLVRLHLTLTDSAALTTSYQYPSFLAVLAGATVDTSAHPGSAGCGLLESVDVMQVGRDVHVTARLSERVDTPAVRIRERGRRVEVVFRSQGRTTPIPDSVLFGRSYDDTIGVVVIDPGHGGEDPGAIGPNGVQEKNVTLAVGLALRDQLKKRSDLKVYMTREKDTFVGLGERTKFANSRNADIFVSIHANAVAGTEARRKSVRGYKMYFLSQAKSEEDRLVAMQENAVVELERASGKANYLQNLLTEMVSSEYLRESQDLSILLAESFGKSLGKVRQLHTGVGQANFYVLNGAFMPAVLVEIAFISHPQEERLLDESAFQKDVAKAIFDAIVDFKKKYGGGR